MSGSREGGLKVAEKMKAKDPDFYRKIALKAQESWRSNGRAPRGFAAMDPEELRAASAKGGRISKRGPKKEVKR